MEELISVIIPVYNVKPYLKECVDSVINQSYRNLEIILVDDGSNDGSEMICDEYCKKDSRVKVIHQENKGLSVARNIGIEHSKGDFLTFVDSDDYIHKEMLMVLYDSIKEYDSDISVCNYSNAGMLEVVNKKNVKVFNELEEMLGELYKDNCICFGTAWGKIYKRKIFDEIRYPANRRYEDNFVAHRIFEIANRLVYSDNKLYCYRLRKDSIMNMAYSLKNLDEIDAIYDRMNFVKERGYEYFYNRDFYRYINALRRNYENLKRYLPNEKEKMTELLIEFNKYYNLKSRKRIISNKIRFGLDLFHIKSLVLEKIIKTGV